MQSRHETRHIRKKLGDYYKALQHRLAEKMLAAITSPFWLIVALRKTISSRSSQPRILLVSRNEVAGDHLKGVARLCNEIPNAAVYCTNDRFPRKNRYSRIDASRQLAVPSMGLMKALSQYWDLIVFANHPYGMGLCFSPYLTKLYVNHGIHSGKINNDKGHDGVYGKSKVAGPFGGCYYDYMFASSIAERNFALQVNPELKDTVIVAGSLKADDFLSFAGSVSRLSIRQKMKVSEDDCLVHLISTWGHRSLMGQFGDDIIELVKTASNLKFIVSLHPRFDEFPSGLDKTREKILKDFEQAGAIICDGLEWGVAVVAADLVVTDHSSLSFYHALIDNPMILLDVPETEFLCGSAFYRLKERNRLVSSCHDLERAIGSAVKDGARSLSSDVRDSLLSFPGGAHEVQLACIRNMVLSWPNT